MASEATVVSDHSTAPEKVEKVNEEVKEIEESLPASKGSGEQKEPKDEELPCQTAPTSSEVEEKIKEKQIEPYLATEVKKNDDAPVLEVPLEDKSQPETKPTIESVEEQPKEKPVIEVEKQLEVAPEVVEVMEPPVVAEQPVAEPVEKQPQEQQPAEVVEKEAEVQPKIGDTPEPSVEAVEESEKVEVLPVKDSETLAAKDTDSSEEATKKEEISEPIIKVEDKPQVKSETVEVLKKECVETEPKENVEVEIAKDEETLADKIEETKKEEPVVMDKPQEPSESAEKFDEECALVEPKESVKVEIAKVEETSSDKIEDPPLKEEKTDKDEVVATEKAPEQSEVEEVCVVVEPEESLKVEIADKEISADKIEDLLLKEEQTGKHEVVVTEKAAEQSEAAEKFQEVCAEVEPEERVKVEIPKFEETLVDKIEETTKVEPVVTESSDQITPTNVEAEADIKEDGSTVVAENANIVEKEKEKESSETGVVEVLSKEVIVESGKVELESEGKNIETEEEKEEKKVVNEELDEPKTNKVENAISSISLPEVAEKSLEGEISTRGIELFAENGKESIKDKSETVTSVETEKNGEVEEKIVEVTAPTVEVPAEEPKKSEKEVKGEETAETGETNYVKENEAGEIAKHNFPTPEPPKEEVLTKHTSKQSNTIMSKVKQSLVKAKKAIIGKSPNSKTVSSEAKGDIKEK